jgi:hypothetical protein
MDADAYLSAEAILTAAEFIRTNDQRSWVVPYEAMWRIRQAPSERLISSRAEQPMQLTLPPDPAIVQGGENAWDYAYLARNQGALCTVMPSAAFWEVGGMDLRFRGWGGEDTSHAAALDTLWAPRTLAEGFEAAHLWHQRVGEGTGTAGRMWQGQSKPRTGRTLKNKYLAASGNPRAMRSLVADGLL